MTIQSNVKQLLTDHLSIWLSAENEKKSGRGRASGNKGTVYGVQKLRELILELAVRGKLVPQNANEEPVSELLKRIQAEKNKLIAEGKFKKVKPLAPISEDEKPFELPKSWEWIRLGILGDWGAGATPLRSISSYYGGDMPWFKSGELSSDFIDEAEETITELALKECSLRLNQPGDVLIAMYGATIGKAAILKVPATTNQAVCACTPNGTIFNRYLLVLLKAMKSNFIGQGAGGAQPNISREKIIATIAALPPLAEQHRIVAKVDELMALCDQLEQQHSNAQQAHETLVNILLGTLTQSQNAKEFQSNWQRIAAHFETLFTTQASIDALKQTLLQLAVMGKLVPQDPNDEPASELLKRIQAEKAKLIAEGKLKKEKPLVPISEEEKPFELPRGWSFARLRELATHLGDGLHGTPVYDASGRYYFVNGNNLKDGKIIIKPETKTVDVTEYEKYKKPLNTSSILVSINGTLGTVGFYDGEPIILGKSACYINLVEEKLSKHFVKLIIDAPSFMEYALKNAAGTTIKNLGLKAINEMPIALPPLAEQHRIVSKVDELMALCDQLSTRIQQAGRQQQLIAHALVKQALKPATAEIIDLPSYRAAIACYAINKMQNSVAFGRTQAMKLLYLSQNHLGLDMNMQFEREAAGPFTKWIYEFERQSEQANWFTVVEKSISDSKTKVQYQVKSGITKPIALIETLSSSEQRKELDRILALFADRNTEEAEIIATLFAVWNDFLIGGITPDDAQIIKEVRENLHESKARFSPSELTKWLEWMRSKHLVPKGRLSHTVYQKSLIEIN